MLIKQLIREALELQGFRIKCVEKKDSDLLITVQPDLRYRPTVEHAEEPVTIVILYRNAAFVSYLYGVSSDALKETFRDFWQSATKDVAAKHLGQWSLWADESMLKPMQDGVPH